MWDLNEVTAPSGRDFQPVSEVSTKLFQSSYESNIPFTRAPEKVAGFPDVLIADGSFSGPAGSGSVGDMESALTKGIESVKAQSETNQVTTRFDKEQQRNDGRDFWYKQTDKHGEHSLQVETKYQYELRTDRNGFPHVQLVGEKRDFGNITYKMQDNGDALVRVKYGDSHDPNGPLVQPGDQFWIYVPGREGRAAYIYPAATWGKFGPQGAGRDGSKFDEDLNYINSHLKKPAQSA